MKERLRRLHASLDYVNNLLLIPMIALLFVELISGLSTESLFTAEATNLVLCGSFFTEWALGLYLAPSRLAYLKNPAALIDLVSSIPFGPVFQSARLGRLVRLVRLVRVVLGSRRLRGASQRMLRVLAILGALVAAGAVSIQAVEPSVAPTIEDAIWFTLSTISTVGYGDTVPHTTAGRTVAGLLMLFGVSLFGYVAGFMAGLVEDPDEDEILSTVKRIEAQVAALSGTRGTPSGEAAADRLPEAGGR